MKTSKVIRIAQSFSSAEWKRFEKFLASPYHNESPLMVQLGFRLREAVQRQEIPDRVEVYSALTQKSFAENNWKQLLHRLFKLMESFLTFEMGQASDSAKDWDQQLHLLTTYRKRNLRSLYLQQMSRMKKRETQSPFRDVDYYFRQYQLIDEGNQFYATERARGVSLDLAGKAQTLRIWNLAQQLRGLAELINLHGVLGETVISLPPQIEIEELLAAAQNPKMHSIAAIELYALTIRSLLFPMEHSHYHRLKTALETSIHQFKPEEARSLYTFATNYCIRKINQGERSFLEELFQLNQSLLSKGLLHQDGTLSPWHYKNIVINGLRIGAFEWVETFIETAKSDLPEAFRENAHTYNSAKLAYYRGDHSRVLKLLQSVEYEDIFYSLDAKAMLMKVYFETQEIDALEALCHSFARFLRRDQKVSASHRQNYLNFIRFVNVLSNLAPGDHEGLLALQLEIQETQGLADRDWLLERIIV